MAEARHALTLYDYSDRELLHMIIDEADPSTGWVSVHDLAEALAIDHKHPGQCVGTRLGWLRRYGAVERAEGKSEWRLTRQGMALALGDLTPEEQAFISGLSTEKMLGLSRAFTTRYRRVGMTAAHLMRREWQLGAHQRKVAGR